MADSPSLGEARDALLRRILSDASSVPADQLRNLATAYGILTDKSIALKYPFQSASKSETGS